MLCLLRPLLCVRRVWLLSWRRVSDAHRVLLQLCGVGWRPLPDLVLPHALPGPLWWWLARKHVIFFWRGSVLKTGLFFGGGVLCVDVCWLQSQSFVLSLFSC